MSTSTAIREALEKHDIPKAESIFKSAYNTFKQTKSYDSLPELGYWAGRIAQEKNGKKAGIRAVHEFISDCIHLNIGTELLKNCYREAAGYFEFVGENGLAYDANLKAFEWAEKSPKTSFKEKGRIQNNLSTYALYLGKRNLARQHAFQAVKLYYQEPNPDFESLYFSFNTLGNIHYYGSRFDSAEFYYKKALEQFPKMENTPRNLHYRPAMVLNNLAGVQSLSGKNSEAIGSMESVINSLNTYVSAAISEQDRQRGNEFLYQAMDNLAGMHKSTGNFSKAKDILEFSIAKKVALFGPNSPEIFKSEVLLGQVYFSLRESGQALQYLLQAIAYMDSFGEDYLDWKADALTTLAQLEKSQGNTLQALQWYSKAQNAYRKVMGGDFDIIYLDFLKEFSSFYAELGKRKEALAISAEAITYIESNYGKGSLLDFIHQVNLAQIHYSLNDYTSGKTVSGEALHLFESGMLNQAQSRLDSIQILAKKPKAILVYTKSSYKIQEVPTEEFLESLLRRLHEAIDILESRKSFIEQDQDLRILIAEHQELYDFTKQIHLQLNQLNPNLGHAEAILQLHEAAVFNRLRSRLQVLDQIQFAGLPEKIHQEEKQIQTAILLSLQDETQETLAYLEASERWQSFLQKLEKDFPEYYRFRYGKIEKSLPEIQQSLPPNTSLIRYIFVESALLALVIDSKEIKMVRLPQGQIEILINQFSTHIGDSEKALPSLNQLYHLLWAPIEQHLKHERVIIIPDGTLNNLSFELLTPKLLTDFSQLLNGSLLSKYTISYHYHSYLIRPLSKPSKAQSNYIAFAPGFSDQLKQKYLRQVKDSLQIDQAYLTLIPQPFTLTLVGYAKKLLGGKLFTEDKSTLQNFIQNASQHRIIHIGTHAKSDNLSPSYSKLIFSKSDIDPSPTGNELYSHQIYQLSLDSDIVVLTACETGKSSIDPGEGMLSMAHAFSYAGSKSLLVGLWKIDEQVSAQIAQFFFEHLSEGMDKASALRQAKIQFLQQTEGRSLSPEFWAGLVLIGDPEPIQLEKSNTWLYFGILTSLLLLGAAWRWWISKA